MFRELAPATEASRPYIQLCVEFFTLLSVMALLTFFCCILVLAFTVFVAGILVTRGKKLLEGVARRFR